MRVFADGEPGHVEESTHIAFRLLEPQLGQVEGPNVEARSPNRLELIAPAARKLIRGPDDTACGTRANWMIKKTARDVNTLQLMSRSLACAATAVAHVEDIFLCRYSEPGQRTSPHGWGVMKVSSSRTDVADVARGLLLGTTVPEVSPHSRQLYLTSRQTKAVLPLPHVCAPPTNRARNCSLDISKIPQ